MSELNRLKVVDFTAGRLSSDDINTDIPFRDNLAKTRTIQQANAVIGAYVNRNYADMQNKADIDDIPTKLSELANDVGYITTGDIPSKTSDLINDGEDGEHPFITKEVDNLTNYTDTTTLNSTIGTINNNIGTNTTNISNIKSAIDYKSTKYIGDIIVNSVSSKNMFDGLLEEGGYTNVGAKDTYSTPYRNCNTVEVEPSTTYTLSINGVKQRYVIFYYDLARNFLSNENSDGTFTTPINCYYVNFRCFANDYTPDFKELKIQFEKNDVATPYKVYQNLNNIKIYNEDTLHIGYWVDGKPLYRKTYKCENKTSAYSITAPNNIDYIKIDINQKDSGGAYIGTYYASASDYLRTFYSSGNIQVRTSKADNTFTHWITIEYTKTTD